MRQASTDPQDQEGATYGCQQAQAVILLPAGFDAAVREDGGQEPQERKKLKRSYTQRVHESTMTISCKILKTIPFVCEFGAPRGSSQCEMLFTQPSDSQAIQSWQVSASPTRFQQVAFMSASGNMRQPGESWGSSTLANQAMACLES